MKLRDLFWFATGATISYQLVKNREPLKNEFSETKQLTEGIQSNLSNIKKKILILQATSRHLKAIRGGVYI